jgi:small subunit ribosomal protein S18
VLAAKAPPLHSASAKTDLKNSPLLSAICIRHSAFVGRLPADKITIDTTPSRFTLFLSFKAMSTSEQKQQTPTPAEIPFTQPQAMIRYVTDTGKILPRKYTGLSAKHQRAVTRTIKHSRNMLLAQ